MIKTLTKSIRQYKSRAILTPIIMVGEAAMEILIPFMMTKLIAVIEAASEAGTGLTMNDVYSILMYGGIMLAMAIVSLTCGIFGGKLASEASAGFVANLRDDMYDHIQTYSFANIDEYNTKTKTLAKDEADLIQNASFMMAGRDDEGNQLYTLRDYTANTQNSIDNIFESFWNDPTAFNPKGTGDDGDLTGYGYKSVYAVTAVTVSVGDTSQTTPTYLYSNASSAVGDYTEYPEWTEVTGTFTASAGGAGTSDNGGGLDTATIAWLSALSVVAVVGVALAIVAVVKKKSTPKSDE